MTSQISNPSKRLLRVREAAIYIGVSRKKLRIEVQHGRLAVIRHGRNAPWLLDVLDLNRWIEQHKEVL